MVNLNAQRNLPPDSTPWGKTIEQRISYLERQVPLLEVNARNQEAIINTLTTRLNYLTRNSLIEDIPATYTVTPGSPSGKISGDVPVIVEGTYQFAQFGGLLTFGAPNNRALASVSLSVSVASLQNTSGIPNPFVGVTVFIKEPTTGEWEVAGTPDVISLANINYLNGYNFVLSGQVALSLPVGEASTRLEATVGVYHAAFTSQTEVTLSSLAFEVITA